MSAVKRTKVKLLVLFLAMTVAGVIRADWPMCGANPQRTSSVTEEVRGTNTLWYRPVEPFINYKIQVIAANNKVFMSTARGLYCFDANNGDIKWVHATQVPLGHSPTYYNGKLYVGSYDRTIHCVGESDGKTTANWNPAVALAGFETNPLVIDTISLNPRVRVYAGNRDGYFYCLDANTGALIWRYKAGGAIRLSAAIDSDNVIYFAAENLYAYALKDNGATYQEMWKSGKFPGEGFTTYWPVVYDEKSGLKRKFVLFSGSSGYFLGHGFLVNPDGANLVNLDRSSIGASNPVGPLGTEPGDWAPGTVTMDVSRICQYYESKPYRRRVFMLNRTDGREFTYDSDGDGLAEYAPFPWTGAVISASKYPPIVGNDGVLYCTVPMNTALWVPFHGPSGWKVGTQYVGIEAGAAFASDEPTGYSVGGNLLYTVLCGDRESHAFDLNIPYGQSNRNFDLWPIYMDRFIKFPNYEPMYADPLDPFGVVNIANGWELFGSARGVYGKHGVQNPWVPYNGKLYHQMGNCVVAESATGTATGPLPMAVIQPIAEAVPYVAVSQLKQRLEEEVQKMISLGHLKPGLSRCSGTEVAVLGGNNPSYFDLDNGDDYFCNPADTIYTLVRALPHLSESLKAQTSAYIKTEMANYPIDSVTHVGFVDGSYRQAADIPPEPLPYYTAFGKQTTVSGNYPWNFPMTSFYAAWKYSQAWPSEAIRLYNSMKSKVTVPVNGSLEPYLTQSLQMLNAYLAGYKGYLELEKMAGQPVSTNVQNEYNRLLTLRANNVDFTAPTKVVPTCGADYGKAISIGRHFLYLVPEVAQDLKSRIPAATLAALLDRINYEAPGWFVSRYDATMYEGAIQLPYDVSVFNGYAMLVQEPYEELLRYLDAPGFLNGDLFYLQNLVSTIEAPPQTAVKLNVTAVPVIAEANGTSAIQVQARVCDSANRTVGSSNATVSFTLSGTAGGSISPASVSASGGIAAITYTAGTTPGTAIITATSAGLTQGAVNIALVANTPPSAPTNLLCNGMGNPTGITDFTPDLSWTFVDANAGSGDTQSAYRILVANSQGNLASNNGNMWDTNKVTSANNTAVYAGATFLANTQYWWKVMTWDSFGAQGQNWGEGTFTMSNVDTRCYKGVPFALPCKIEMEDFDYGGEGVAYHDVDTANNGGAQYRSGEGVDLYSCPDTGGGYTLGGAEAGEWIEYTVDVPASGPYKIEVRVTSPGVGGTFHISFGGVDKTGAMQPPDTGGIDTYQTMTRTGVSLTAGKQLMRVTMDTNGTIYNNCVGLFNYINIAAEGALPATLTVQSPNGGENWTQGTMQTVTWTSYNMTNNVDIEISLNGTTGPWTTLKTATTNDGSEVVTLPATPTSSGRIRIKSVSGSPSDYSDNNFTISLPPPAAITVLAPNGGETWTQGTTNTVTWTSVSVTGNVDIEISYNGTSGPWSGLAMNTANDGIQPVMVPSTLGTSCRIRVKDVSGTPSDYSDGNFTISNVPQPIVSVSPASIDFGSIAQGQTGANTFNITNTGAGTLSGTITKSQNWITVTPASFNGNSATVTVTANTTGLTIGPNTGAVTVTTNGGTATVNITVNVTQSPAQPQITISSTTLSFGELEVGAVSQPQALTITNSGGGTLTGTISTVDSWIKIDNTSFVIAGGASQPLNVSVDNAMLSKKEGPAKGEITITSNGNNGAQVTTTISVEFTATCVLVKPSPAKVGQPITFFGDGIVPGQTTIEIYTLSGELVNILNPQSEICNTQSPQAPGIYIYVYESPKEKGVAKFTVTK